MATGLLKVTRRFCFLVLLLTAFYGSYLPGAGALTSQPAFLIRQGGFIQEIVPLMQEASAPEFYRYEDFQANAALPLLPRRSVLFLYRDMKTGELSLFVIHDAPEKAMGGEVAFDFSGLPAKARIAVQDDPEDLFTYAAPVGKAYWRWLKGRTDGLVISGLGENFEITIAPYFFSGIEIWEAFSGDAKRPTRFALPDLQKPVTLMGRNQAPVAEFTVSPAIVYLSSLAVFDAGASRDPDGAIVQYAWDFDGDGLFERSTDSPIIEHVFNRAGDQRVTLKVIDNVGAVGTVSKVLRVLEGGLRATRTITTYLPWQEVLTGGSFKVKVTIEVQQSVNGMALDEDLPAGWNVNPIESNGAIYKETGTQWIFTEAIPAGEIRTILYEVTIPNLEVPRGFKLEGRVLSASPSLKISVSGDSEVRVIRFLSIKVAISRLNPETDEIDVTLPNLINFEQLLRAVAFWLEDQPVPATGGKKMDLNIMLELIAHWLTDTPVDQPLPK